MENSLSVIPPEKDYYILTFPYYGTLVFYGTYKEASDYFSKMGNREGKGTIRLADPFNSNDRDLVILEIKNIKKDRESGIKNLPYLPGKDWI